MKRELGSGVVLTVIAVHLKQFVALFFYMSIQSNSKKYFVGILNNCKNIKGDNMRIGYINNVSFNSAIRNDSLAQEVQDVIDENEKLRNEIRLKDIEIEKLKRKLAELREKSAWQEYDLRISEALRDRFTGVGVNAAYPNR